MKKIATITMFGDNYGACLQAFALQHVLEERNQYSRIIKYNSFDYTNKKAQTKLQKVKKYGLKKVILYLVEKKYSKMVKDAFQSFRENYLKFDTKEYCRGKDLSELNERYDLFLCGSDMIWSEEFIDDWDFYYLKFVTPFKKNSYAPSFGKNNLTEENKKKVAHYLETFKNLSCRENGGVDLIQSLTEKSVVQVLDPTMLLSANEWNQVIGNTDRIFKEKYVFAYVFGKTNNKRKKIFETVESKIAPVKFIPRKRKKDYDNFPVDVVGPLEYMRLIRDAEFVVTDTFHGLMFSIIFRKPFIVLQRNDGTNWSQYSDRMTSTLKMFGLEERYVRETGLNIDQYKELDYSGIEKVIQQKRDSSLMYLDKVINEK